MAKTVTPGTVDLEHGSFEANAMPDVFDARDLEYRPRLQPLKNDLECRPKDRHVMVQAGNSCTGHAVAAMANAALAARGDTAHVSPYMAYALARRYDDYQGDADEGSSLRGALKGWFYHGLLADSDWPSLDASPAPDIDHDEELAERARQRPLGAFYRVNATRLDDLQSAVSELSAVAAAAAIHDGWTKPVPVTRTVNGKNRSMHVITKTHTSQALGGHAFCIVGYNEVGFLVQNSWGPEWGSKGFATLPYDDWLESGYDAWVARPGVPAIISQRAGREVSTLAGGGLALAPAADINKLAPHVVNVGNNGRLSTSGRFTSSPAQLDQIFARMRASHEEWEAESGAGAESPRRIVFYAHGGLNGETDGLDIAQRQLNWWLANKVYPVTFVWQTGATETLDDQLTDLFGSRLPKAGWSFNLFEQVDRMVEKTAKKRLRWVWDEMKENAYGAADALPRNYRDKPPDKLPGASLTVAKLKEHLAQAPKRPTEVHLVGHSAGSIFLVGLIERLVAAKIPIASLTYLAAALRTDTWVERVLPHLQSGAIRKFTTFGLDPVRELDDVTGGKEVALYHKSLLYLVSRALEPTREETEIPLVGMAHCAKTKVKGTTFEGALKKVGGTAVWSPDAAGPNSRSDAAAHGAFDDDSATMTSVLLRIIDQNTVKQGNEYAPHRPPPRSGARLASEPTELEDQPPEIVTAEVTGTAAAGSPAVSEKQHTPATTRSAARRGTRGSGTDGTVLDALVRAGWTTGSG